MLITLSLSLLIFTIGILFWKFNNHFWNNPLLLISKNRRQVNTLTGKSLVLLSFIYFLVAVYLNGTIFLKVSLYLICIFLNFIIVSLLLILKKKSY